jgi:aspartate/methionine/tyrosine aminotransferase
MRHNFIPFQLEREMSVWEHKVEYNLSESGVEPLNVKALLGDAQKVEAFLNTPLGYPQTNGLIELRERIASLYPDANRDQVLVTNGAAQANFTTLVTLMDPGDQIAVMLPNYMQIWGVAMNYKLDVRPFHLIEEKEWDLDLESLEEAVTQNTRMIAICNPNNPTGHILTSTELDHIVSIASRVGAWILADEVYAGAERLTDRFTPSFWGRYEKVLAVGSMSKAYGLPGLRIGWVIAPSDFADQIWARQDYITISATQLSNRLAAHALSPEVRPQLLQRTRDHIRSGYSHFESWIEKHKDFFSLVPPQAAAIAFVRYRHPINSSELVQRLIREQSVYVVPGDHFGLDHHLRISYGMQKEMLEEGLQRVLHVLGKL